MDISLATQKGKKCVQYTISNHSVHDFDGVYVFNTFFHKGYTPQSLFEHFDNLSFENGQYGGYRERKGVDELKEFTIYKSEQMAAHTPSPFVKKSVKFLKKGIKVNGNYFPVWYSKGNYTPESGIPNDTITIYARNYQSIPNFGVKIENDSDGRTDYFENDRIRITPDSQFYKEVSMVA